ncbi:MAG: hypothetical protein IIV97_04115 [Oscillospiraceae bacterium]|nr:hypothetical protein [Oscillospiraceae bacterium]
MKKLVCILTFTLLFTLQISAQSEFYDAFDIPHIVESAPGESDIRFDEKISFSDGIRKILGDAKESISSMLGRGVRCVGIIMAVSFLCKCVESMIPGEDSAVKSSLSLLSAIAVTGAAAGSITSVMGMCREFIGGVDVFSKALLPSVAAAEAVCGLPGSATAKAAITLVFSDILISLINSVFLPLVYISVFASTANAAAKNSALQKISDFSSKIVSGSLKILLGAFVSYISVSGIITGGVDKAGLKVAQFALGTTVPIVGGAVSEAAETVIAGAAMMKNAIGVFGMLAILSAFVTPFAAMLVNYLSFKAASLVASPTLGGGISELSSRLADGFGLMLGMSATVATVILFAIIAAMRSVGVL